MENPYENNKSMYYFELFANLVTANAIFILSNMAVVTLGIGSVALSDYTKTFRETPYKAGRQILDSTKENWKFGLKVGLIQILFVGAFVINMIGLANMDMNSLMYVAVLSALLFFGFLFLLVFFLIYALPIDRSKSLFDLTLDIFRLGFTNIKKTLLLIGWNILNIVLFVFVLLFSRYLSIYYIAVGFAVQSLVAHHIIRDFKCDIDIKRE